MNINSIYIDADGWLHRIIAEHVFGEVRYFTAEQISTGYSTRVVALPETATLFPSDDAAWQAALGGVTKRRVKEAKEAQAQADAERYGVRVIVRYSSGYKHVDHTEIIVRATVTRYVDSRGHQYKRNTGSRVGDSWGSSTIVTADRDRLASIVGDRAKVDIVAERKRAAQNSETP